MWESSMLRSNGDMDTDAGSKKESEGDNIIVFFIELSGPSALKG